MASLPSICDDSSAIGCSSASPSMDCGASTGGLSSFVDETESQTSRRGRVQRSGSANSQEAFLRALRRTGEPSSPTVPSVGLSLLSIGAGDGDSKSPHWRQRLGSANCQENAGLSLLSIEAGGDDRTSHRWRQRCRHISHGRRAKPSLSNSSPFFQIIVEHDGVFTLDYVKSF